MGLGSKVHVAFFAAAMSYLVPAVAVGDGYTNVVAVALSCRAHVGGRIAVNCSHALDYVQEYARIQPGDSPLPMFFEEDPDKEARAAWRSPLNGCFREAECGVILAWISYVTHTTLRVRDGRSVEFVSQSHGTQDVARLLASFSANADHENQLLRKKLETEINSGSEDISVRDLLLELVGEERRISYVIDPSVSEPALEAAALPTVSRVALGTYLRDCLSAQGLTYSLAAGVLYIRPIINSTDDKPASVVKPKAARMSQ